MKSNEEKDGNWSDEPNSKDLSNEKRIKVRREFPRKYFFEKILFEMRKNAEGRHASVIFAKAYSNLCNYPLETHTMHEVALIRGIGENIAVRLEAAWNVMRVSRIAPPTIEDVKKFKANDFRGFLAASENTSTAAVITKATSDGGNGSQMRLPSKNASESAKETGGKSKESRKKGNTTGQKGAIRKRPKMALAVVPQLDVATQPGPSSGAIPLQRFDSNEPGPSNGSLPDYDLDRFSQPEPAVTNMDNDTEILSYSCNDFATSEVILLIDVREVDGKMRKPQWLKLTLQDVVYDMRALSVGDFAWIVRMRDGSEMMLDYIVERKTFDDLRRSIYQSRYEEQKQRLKLCGLRNVVYVIEGTGAMEAECEQALSTTYVDQGFMIKHTRNEGDTCAFLISVTKRLRRKLQTDNMTAMSFESFQRCSKKTKRTTVTDLFVKQLCVCPGMSFVKASLIAREYPTFSSLAALYSTVPADRRPTLLSDTVGGISVSLSKQMSLFFAQM